MSKPSKIGVAVGAAILLLCGSFGAGRYSRPARVEVREHTVTQTQIVEKIVNHDVIQTQVVHDTVKVDNVVTKIVWEKAPDGTVRTVETITDLSKMQSKRARLVSMLPIRGRTSPRVLRLRPLNPPSPSTRALHGALLLCRAWTCADWRPMGFLAYPQHR